MVRLTTELPEEVVGTATLPMPPVVFLTLRRSA